MSDCGCCPGPRRPWLGQCFRRPRRPPRRSAPEVAFETSQARSAVSRETSRGAPMDALRRDHAISRGTIDPEPTRAPTSAEPDPVVVGRDPTPLMGRPPCPPARSTLSPDAHPRTQTRPPGPPAPARYRHATSAARWSAGRPLRNAPSGRSPSTARRALVVDLARGCRPQAGRQRGLGVPVVPLDHALELDHALDLARALDLPRARGRAGDDRYASM